MSDAPATIWATGNKTTGSWNHTPLSLRIAPVQTEYVRADIAASQFISVLPEAQFAAFAAAVDADGEPPADISQAKIDEAKNQLDSARHSVTVLEERRAEDQARIAELVEAFASELLDMMDWWGTGTSEVAKIEEKEYRDRFAALKAKP
jgi:hypothetical protein